MAPRGGEVEPFDAFDLPEWLGIDRVAWEARSSVRDEHLVAGVLRGSHEEIACDLLAVDRAYPEPLVDDAVRRASHQAWHYGQVMLVRRDERVTVTVPATGFSADLVMEAIARLAKAVGVKPELFVVTMRL